MKRTSLNISDKSSIHIFQTSILPFMTGSYEFTINFSITEYSDELIWAGDCEENWKIVISPESFDKSFFSPSSGFVRQVFTYLEELTYNCDNQPINNIKSFCISLLAGIAYEKNINIDYIHSLVHILSVSNWFLNYSNCFNLFLWYFGDIAITNHFLKKYILFIL